jgi:hypothetical protein
MKTKLIAFSIAVLIVAGILSACNQPANKGEESQAYKDSVAQANTIVADTTSTVKTDWEKFKSDASEKIRQNEDTIATFKEKIAKENSKIKAKYEKVIARMEERNKEMKAKLEDFKAEDKVKFEKFKVDFDNSMDTLGVDIKDFFKGKKKS